MLERDLAVSTSELIANPYPAYHRLRSSSPVHWSETLECWILTRYQDVDAVLTNETMSAERLAPNVSVQALGGLAAPATRALMTHLMLFADDPSHRRLRGLVSRAFTPRAVSEMRGQIQAIVDEILAAARSAGQMDIIADLAAPLPLTVILRMLGIPAEERDQFKRWSDDLAVVAGGTLPSEQQMQRLAVAGAEIRDHLGRAFEARRREPRDDLLSWLVQAEEEGDRLTPDELYANAVLLLIAGHETTTNLIGNGIWALMTHPDQLLLLRQEPQRLNNAIEEMLRFDSPVQMTARLAARDTDISGTTVRAGQFVRVILGAANRDPEQFPDPDRLDLTRENIRHLAFAHGPHYCLGAPLARLEAGIAIGTVVERMPNLRLIGEAPPYHENFNLRGLASLPVAF